MASRTFQHRVTLPAVVVIVLVAAVAFSFLMSRDTVLSVVALILVCLDVVIMERVIHTSYTLTDDGMLLVDRGRFARRQTIHVSIHINESRINSIKDIIDNHQCIRQIDLPIIVHITPLDTGSIDAELRFLAINTFAIHSAEQHVRQDAIPLPLCQVFGCLQGERHKGALIPGDAHIPKGITDNPIPAFA